MDDAEITHAHAFRETVIRHNSKGSHVRITCIAFYLWLIYTLIVRLQYSSTQA